MPVLLLLLQNISNLAWSYGRLSLEHPNLFAALTSAAKTSNLEGWGNQNVTDLAWGCAATKYQVRKSALPTNLYSSCLLLGWIMSAVADSSNL